MTPIHNSSFSVKNTSTSLNIYEYKTAEIYEYKKEIKGQADIKVVTVLEAAPKIKNIGISGGGASGPTVLSSIGELNNTFKNIAGVSAGALIGILLASGFTTEEAGKKLDDISLPSALGLVHNFKELYPDITFKEEKLYPGFWNLVLYFLRMLICKIFLKIWQVPAEAVVQVLDKLTSESVSRHLKAEWSELETAFCNGIITKEEKERLRFLKKAEWFDTLNENKTSRTKYMITFNDLEILHRVLPNTFKKLYIICARKIKNDKQNFEKAIFDAEKTSDAPIAIIGRATASIPFCFKDVIYQGEIYTDGEVVSHTPVEVFFPEENNVTDYKSHNKNASTYAETAFFIFRNKRFRKDVNNLLYKKPSLPSGSFGAKLAGYFFNNPEFHKISKQKINKLYDIGMSVYVADNGDIDTFDMHTSKEKYAEVNKKSRTYMREQLNMRNWEKTAYALSFTSMKEAKEYFDSKVQENLPNTINKSTDATMPTSSQNN